MKNEGIDQDDFPKWLVMIKNRETTDWGRKGWS
jgi:hypothetical protein